MRTARIGARMTNGTRVNRYSVVLVGLGRIGFDGWSDNPSLETHFRTIWAHPRLRLTAGIDTNPDRRRKFQAATGLPVYETGDFLSDITVICTPPENHLDAVMNARTRGILCEKPLANTVNDAATIVEMCRQKGITLVVGHQRRYEARHRKVRSIIQSGLLGTPLAASCEFAIGPSGTFLSNGSHAVDVARFLAGDETPRSIRPGDGFYINVACGLGSIAIESRGRLEPGYLTEMYDNLISCMESGESPECSGEDGLIAVKEALAAEELWRARYGADTGSVARQEDPSAKSWNASLSGTTAYLMPGCSIQLPAHSTEP